MTPKRLTNFRIDSELLNGLEQIRTRESWSVSWQVREAIKDWLKKNGVIGMKSERKRVSARRRP